MHQWLTENIRWKKKKKIERIKESDSLIKENAHVNIKGAKPESCIYFDSYWLHSTLFAQLNVHGFFRELFGFTNKNQTFTWHEHWADYIIVRRKESCCCELNASQLHHKRITFPSPEFQNEWVAENKSDYTVSHMQTWNSNIHFAKVYHEFFKGKNARWKSVLSYKL